MMRLQSLVDTTVADLPLYYKPVWDKPSHARKLAEACLNGILVYAIKLACCCVVILVVFPTVL